MENLVNALSQFIAAIFNAVGYVVSGAIAIFAWPASVVGMPPELFAAALLLVLLIVLWRTIGNYIT